MNNLYGLMGEKLRHSFSPQIHSLIFKELKIQGYYHLFEIEKNDLKDAVLGLKALGIKGVNVTIPYKIEVIKYLGKISDEAKKIGAINTICFKDNVSIGYNTDYMGFGMMLKKNDIVCKNKKAVILGTGGASNAVSQYLLDEGISEIVFISRDIQKAKEKYNDFKIVSYDNITQLKGYDIAINCTPVGMYPNADNSPINKSDISRFYTVIDLVYNPRETLFLKYAKEQGLKAVNGLFMLVGQAIKAEELWNNTRISDKITDKIYERIEFE